MTSSAVYTCCALLLAAVTMPAVQTIGPCNNTLVKEIMDANAKACPTDLLEQMYSKGSQVTFRIMARKIAAVFSCCVGVMDKPYKNVAVLHNTFSYVNKSLSHAYVDFTLVEAKCGLLFKYIEAETFTGFKMVYAYMDNITYGYYGCSNENNPFHNDGDIYAMCYTPFKDSEEVEASLLKCKAHMERVTGATDLVLTPPCDKPT